MATAKVGGFTAGGARMKYLRGHANKTAKTPKQRQKQKKNKSRGRCQLKICVDLLKNKGVTIGGVEGIESSFHIFHVITQTDESAGPGSPIGDL